MPYFSNYPDVAESRRTMKPVTLGADHLRYVEPLRRPRAPRAALEVTPRTLALLPVVYFVAYAATRLVMLVVG